MVVAKEKSSKVGKDLTKGSIVKSLLLFAGPIILTNLIQQLYSMVDLAIIGQYVGKTGTIGVSTGGEIADLMAPIAMGFSTAAQIYIAQLVGAKMEDKIKKTVTTVLASTFLISLVCAVASIILCVPILNLMNCPESALGQAESYMIITAIGFPFIFGYNSIVGILRGMGESKRPLYFISIAAVVNIVFDYLLVAGFHLEAAGTAIATVLSQFGSFAAALYFLYKYRERFDFQLKLSHFKMDGESFWIILKLAIPQIARSMMVRLLMMWVNSHVNVYGDTVSATNGIGNKLQKCLEVVVNGIDGACAAMIGQNLGAKQYDRSRKIIWTTLACCELVAGIICGVCLLMPRQLFGLMTNDLAVIETGVRYLQILCFHFIISAFTATMQSMVTGSGFVSFGFALGVLDGLARIGMALLFFNVFQAGYESYWWGTAFARMLTGIACFWYFLSNRWKTRKLLTEK